MCEQSLLNADEINTTENNFEKLPLELLAEIFKYLSISDRNKVRRVAFSWDRAIRLTFGVKIILNNHNIRDVADSSYVHEIQVRNLTSRLPPAPLFSWWDSVHVLELIGMILSGNLMQLCREFQNLSFLKFNRVYLETDRQVSIRLRDNRFFPQRISSLAMRFLKTIYRHAGVSLGRNNDLCSLATSDIIILNILSAMNFPKLINFQFYHSMDEDTEAERNSDMITCCRNLELDTDVESTRLLSGFIENSWRGGSLKKIKVDNIPRLILTTNNLARTPSFQLAHLEVHGMMDGHWVSLLDSQSQLIKLKLVLLTVLILENVKNTIRRNASTLKEISLVIATPNDMLLSEDVPQEHSTLFDIMFITDCRHLLHFTLQYAPKIIDVSYLPLSLKSMNICGNVQGLISYLPLATELNSLTLDICDGPVVRDLPPEKTIFTQLTFLKMIITDTGICKLSVSEMGAKDEYKNFLALCQSRNHIEATLGRIVYKMTFPQHADIGMQGLVIVPRLKIYVGVEFNRKEENCIS